jgi:peptidoglycan/LPS O-acetylase OafA/YrhL
MSTETSAFTHRPDLDALRATAMVLGIVLHATLSFFPSFWMVVDRRGSAAFAILFSAIHGFRMPLFFVMSGFFSAMLLHRRGRRALVKHRFRRVFLPMLLGLFTVVPLTSWISSIATSSASTKPTPAPPDAGNPSVWSAAQAGDLPAIERNLANGVAVNAPDPEHGGTPLLWAAANGEPEIIEFLIQQGADVNAADPSGGTALHAAAFLGHVQAVKVLVKSGARINAPNKRGDTPLDGATLDEATTRYFAKLLDLKLNEAGLSDRKAAITKLLRDQGAKPGPNSGLVGLLMQMPLFHHLWFLWFLWWLVVGYAILSTLGSRLPSLPVPKTLILTPARYLWLIPLTMIPQSYMGYGEGFQISGPDSSTGLLPIPHVFAYYTIFFTFGVLYYKSSDNRPDGISNHWWIPLCLALLIILPLGIDLIQAWLGPQSLGLKPAQLRTASILLQSAYPWLMTFSLMGLFHRICSAESPRLRYLSDSAYWLYLAHLPLIIAAQYAVRDWSIPALAKFMLIVMVATAFLLWTYRYLVRYTWLGRFLNGPRHNPTRSEAPSLAA